MQRGGFIYIMTNAHHTVLDIGVTSNLPARIHQHKNHDFKNSYTDRYNIEKLVYYEDFYRIEEAIAREKQVKKYSREKKEILINQMNPEWKDLWEIIEDW